MPVRLSISRFYDGPNGQHVDYPPVGPTLATGWQRALLGWTVQTDTRPALMDPKNQLWCWVTSADQLHVYLADYNRGDLRAQHYDTAHTNFSRVRMFHKYWCPNDKPPRDLVAEDKAQTRALYGQLIQHYVHQGGDGGHMGGGGGVGHGSDRDDDEDYNNMNDDDNPGRTLTDPQRLQRWQERHDAYRKYCRAQVERHRGTLHDRVRGKISRTDRLEMGKHSRAFHRRRAKHICVENAKSNQKRTKTVRSSTTRNLAERMNTRRPRSTVTASHKDSPAPGFTFSSPDRKAQPITRLEISDDESYEGEYDDMEVDDGQPSSSRYGGRVLLLDDDEGDGGSLLTDTVRGDEIEMRKALDQIMQQNRRGSEDANAEGLAGDDDSLFLPPVPPCSSQDSINNTSGSTDISVESSRYQALTSLPSDQQDTQIKETGDGLSRQVTTELHTSFNHNISHRGAQIKCEQKPSREEFDQWFIDNSAWDNLEMECDDDLAIVGVRTRSPRNRTNPREEYCGIREGDGSQEHPLSFE